MARDTLGEVKIAVLVALLGAGACSDNGGCSTQPLPAGGLPASQTIEGGAQIRVTRQGFQKLTSAIPDLVNAQLADGLCVPEGTQSGVHYCYETQGTCAPGCDVALTLNQTQLVATNASTLTLRVDLGASATVPTTASGFAPCYLYANGDHLYADADIVLAPDSTTGELTVTVAQIKNVDLSRLDVTGSGGFCSGASAFADFLKGYLAQQIADSLTPQVNSLIASYLPDPLGLEGVLPVGAASLEARVVPGGFATVYGNSQLQVTGATLGVITGINSDRDPSTRDGVLASEPALCVPPLLPPTEPLPMTSRGTYVLPAADGFSGMPDPLGRDISIGLSERALDLAGHHAVASGAACLGIGTALVPQLNLGTFGLLVPSAAELGDDDGNSPMLLVTRPQRAIDFSIGDNAPGSPAVTAHLEDFQVDIYAFLFERYTRIFTVALTANVGLGTELEQQTDGSWQVVPTLVGLDASDVAVTVSNSAFLAESPSDLEMALPSVLDVLTSQLSLPTLTLPAFAGFTIDNPSIAKVTSPDSDFLALSANLVLASSPITSTKVEAHASLRSVEAASAGSVPTITIDTDPIDALGRPLEWSWRVGDGIWHAYTASSPLVIRDHAFLWQGAYTLGLRARTRTPPAATSGELHVPVMIDSVGPRVVASKTGWRDTDYVVAAFDVVTGHDVRIAFGRAGDVEPRTPWTIGATARVPRDLMDADLAVFLEDANGNRSIAILAPSFHGTAGSSGCGCGTTTPDGSVLLLLGIAGLVLRSRRR